VTRGSLVLCQNAFDGAWKELEQQLAGIGRKRGPDSEIDQFDKLDSEYMPGKSIYLSFGSFAMGFRSWWPNRDVFFQEQSQETQASEDLG
jgi:hypothetical protein